MNPPGWQNETTVDGERYPLFPLDALLMPHASIPLQIFEPRYLMMVSRCSREDAGFVMTLAEPSVTRETLGCWGKIIDFGQTDAGLLGVTVAGMHRVAVSGAARDDTGLWWGDVEIRPEDPVERDDEERCRQRYQPLLDALLQHPYLANQPGVDLSSPRGAVHQLMVWLPLESAMKRHLLAENNFVERCRLLEDILSDLAGSTIKF